MFSTPAASVEGRTRGRGSKDPSSGAGRGWPAPSQRLLGSTHARTSRGRRLSLGFQLLAGCGSAQVAASRRLAPQSILCASECVAWWRCSRFGVPPLWGQKLLAAGPVGDSSLLRDGWRGRDSLAVWPEAIGTRETARGPPAMPWEPRRGDAVHRATARDKGRGTDRGRGSIAGDCYGQHHAVAR
jgi:hypothetical protein